MKTGVGREKTRDLVHKMKILQMIFMKLTQEEHISVILVHNRSYLCNQYFLQILCSALGCYLSKNYTSQSQRHISARVAFKFRLRPTLRSLHACVRLQKSAGKLAHVNCIHCSVDYMTKNIKIRKTRLNLGISGYFPCVKEKFSGF